MLRVWLFGIVFLIPWIAADPIAFAQSKRAIEESFFVKELYPLLHRVQCHLCHNDNGVASGTQLEFPSENAREEQLIAFGLGLIDVIDRQNPRRSLLFLKPTNREEHTGGERIKPGSDEEKVLLSWIDYLAGLSGEQLRLAREKIARVRQSNLSALAVRRLTHTQYNHTVRDLLGDQTSPARRFPKEDFVRGFKNQIEGQGISPLQAEAYGKAAERLAAAAVRGDRMFVRRPAADLDEQAADRFVRQFGLKAFRRPLSDSEVGTYARLFRQEAGRVGQAAAGARLVVEAMLQSPHFLFRIERGVERDRGRGSDRDRGGSFEQYELASRLSYLLWDTMPSKEMLDAAGRGEYATVEQVERAARRMLDDPRAQTALEEFLAQWMRFDRVLTATRDRRRYGQFSSDIAAAMVEETRRLFNHLVWADRNFMEFFTADYTFVNSDLARVYGLPAPADEFGLVKYPAGSGRSGVLGHGTFLVATSKPSETSPTERGLFIRNHFLGQEVPPPPPGVNTALPNITKDTPMTNRQRLELHLNSEACSSCHRLIDTIGLGFEQYDAVGGFREKMSLRFRDDQYGRGRGSTTEVELKLDTSAHVQGIKNSAFSTPKQLGRILAENEACQKCIVKQLFRYAFGREETSSDQPVIDMMLARFRETGFRFRELLVALVTSELFLQRGS